MAKITLSNAGIAGNNFSSRKYADANSLQALIDIIARVKKELDLSDTEIRGLFKTDELTDIYDVADIRGAAGGYYEPGHKYRIMREDKITPVAIVSAISNEKLSRIIEIPADGYEKILICEEGFAAEEVCIQIHDGSWENNGASEVATFMDLPTEIPAADVQKMFMA